MTTLCKTAQALWVGRASAAEALGTRAPTGVAPGVLLKCGVEPLAVRLTMEKKEGFEPSTV